MVVSSRNSAPSALPRERQSLRSSAGVSAILHLKMTQKLSEVAEPSIVGCLAQASGSHRNVRRRETADSRKSRCDEAELEQLCEVAFAELHALADSVFATEARLVHGPDASIAGCCICWGVASDVRNGGSIA